MLVPTKLEIGLSQSRVEVVGGVASVEFQRFGEILGGFCVPSQYLVRGSPPVIKARVIWLQEQAGIYFLDGTDLPRNLPSLGVEAAQGVVLRRPAG